MRRLLILLFATLLAACGKAPLQEQQAYVFGTRVEVVVVGENPDLGRQAIAAVLREFDRMHRTYHAWQPSELTAVNEAIAAGKLPPCLVVFVNGLPMGMYVDWTDGSAPVESMILKDLLPHVDATYRTVAAREGRLLDGFSMGGYGAARLGFKHPELFGAVSIVGAGPLQPELKSAPRASPIKAEEVLRRAYGGDQANFREASPRRLAERNAKVLKEGSLIRMVIGDRDETFANNADFHRPLEILGIPHGWTVIPGVGHDPDRVFDAMGDANWGFYRQALGDPAKSPVNRAR